MAITDRRIGTQTYGGKAPTKYTVYKPPKPQPKPKPVATIKDFKVADAAMSKAQELVPYNKIFQEPTGLGLVPYNKIFQEPIPKQIQAEVGDSWEDLARKAQVDAMELLNVNPKDTTIKAGAVYNVPRNLPEGVGVGAGTNLGVGVGAGTNLGVGEDIADWWKDTAVPWLDKQRQAIYDWGMSPDRWGSGKGAENYIFPEPTPTPGGGKPQQSLVDPFKQSPRAEYADFRKADEAASTTYPSTTYQRGVASGEIPEYEPYTSPLRGIMEGVDILNTPFADYVRSQIDLTFPKAVAEAQNRPGREELFGNRPGLEDISFIGEPGFVPPVKTPADTINELRTLKIPSSPSMFEAVNWLTGAGLTGTALLSAGRQLRLDRPEYWDATGTREDIKEGVDRFLFAEFGLPNGDIDWEAAIKQDPYMVDTLEKLGYLDAPEGEGLGDYSGYGYGGYDYSFPTGSYGYGGVGVEPRSRSSQYPSNIGLVAWSV